MAWCRHDRAIVLAIVLPIARPEAAGARRLNRRCRHPQASVWEHSAVLSNQQQAALDVISASCGQRPMPTQLAAGRPSGATPLPTALLTPAVEPLSPSATEAAEASFVGTSFEDVTLQASAGCKGWRTAVRDLRLVAALAAQQQRQRLSLSRSVSFACMGGLHVSQRFCLLFQQTAALLHPMPPPCSRPPTFTAGLGSWRRLGPARRKKSSASGCSCCSAAASCCALVFLDAWHEMLLC